MRAAGDGRCIGGILGRMPRLPSRDPRGTLPLPASGRRASVTTMARWIVLVALLAALAGCSRTSLPESVVRAASVEEFTAFRTELGDRFAAADLQPFDTAIQELKLEAMNRNIAGVAARDQYMLEAVNGRTVLAALRLGWQARRARLLAEQAELTRLLERDVRLHEKAAESRADEYATRVQNEREIIARLQRDVAEAERRLAEWGAGAP